MVRIFYPSDDFPSPTPFLLTVPDDWLAVHAPQALLAARAAQGEAEFVSNVTVTWDRAAPDVKAEEIGLQLADRFGGQGELEGSTSDLDFDGSIALVRVRREIADVGVTQLAMIVVGPKTSGRTRDVFEVVVSCGTDNAKQLLEAREILESFSFLDLASDPDAARDSPTEDSEDVIDDHPAAD